MVNRKRQLCLSTIYIFHFELDFFFWKYLIKLMLFIGYLNTCFLSLSAPDCSQLIVQQLGNFTNLKRHDGRDGRHVPHVVLFWYLFIFSDVLRFKRPAWFFDARTHKTVINVSCSIKRGWATTGINARGQDLWSFWENVPQDTSCV